MKKLILIVSCVALLGGNVGCGTSTPATVAYKTSASVEATVESALNAWYDHVNLKRAALARSPNAEVEKQLTRQEGQVQIALADYQKAIASEHAGVNAALSSGQSPASSALIAAANAFTSLVLPLIKN